MLNLTTKTNAATVISAIIADINAVNVSVRGVAHMLTVRLDYWLFSSTPMFYEMSSHGHSSEPRGRFHQMRQQFKGLIKHQPVCCPATSRGMGGHGGRQAVGIPGSMG